MVLLQLWKRIDCCFCGSQSFIASTMILSQELVDINTFNIEVTVEIGYTIMLLNAFENVYYL